MPGRRRRYAIRGRPQAASRVMAMIRLVTCVACPLAIWGCLALWYRAPGGRWLKILAVAAWAVFSVLTLLAVSGTHPAFASAAFAAAFGALLLWWHRLVPSNDRDWADDVAQMTSGTVQGSHVVLHNVRNFDWRSEADYTQRWETRSYDLEHLRSLDMIMSYWTIRPIAHVLISFGFDGGDHVAFSVEIRRERNEEFSAIGGFFKEFELCILAADERDVIRLRTNVRREDAYLYRIRIPESAMRSLFLAYIGQANGLVRTPRFYNTVTVNCTTLIYHMMSYIVGHLPLDFRLLFSGYLPGYVYRLGALDRGYTLEELRSFGRVTERARRSDGSGSFSAAIRQGMPG
jgi:Domain of unknown function (DUF4105)